MKARRRALLASAVFALAFTSTFVADVVAADRKPIKVGVSISLTSDFAISGLQQKAGIEMAVDEINRAGGVPGKGDHRPIELVYGDNAMSPTTAVNALNRILSADPVAVLLSIRGTHVLPQLPLLQRAKIAGLTISGTRKITEQGNDYVFRFYPNDGVTKPILTRFVVAKLGKKKIGVFHSAEDYGSSGRDEIVKTLKELKLEPVAVESHQPTDKDFTAQLQAFKAAGAEIILLQTFEAPSALILKQARQLNLGVPFGLGVTSVGASALKLVEPRDIEGFYAETGVVDPPFSTDPKVRAWAAEVQKRFDIVPDYTAQIDYDAMKMLAKAIELYGPDREAIAQGLHVLKYRGLDTEYQSDSTGNMNHEASIVQIRDKKQIPVERGSMPFEPWSKQR
ncbi:MAG: ABC transporter substrate-binding protein [Burkholderiales bacterium]|nr:ABC transporter substrate-binding protein [Burkholderiales bacterium]